MRYYFLFMLAIVSCLSCANGTVVFLRGTGCAGKTSLSSTLETQNENWQAVNEDDIFYEEAAKRWKSEFSQEFDAIEEVIDSENVLHAVMRNQMLFKPKATDDKKSKAKQAITAIQNALNEPTHEDENDSSSWSNGLRTQIVEKITKLAQTHNVMVDTWFLKPEHIELISNEYPTKNVVAYCPLLELVKRTFKRNYEAHTDGKDISNLRFFHQALMSFTGLYDLEDKQDASIDCLDKEETMHGLNLVELCLQDSPQAMGASKKFTRGEFSLAEFAAYRKEMTDALDANKVYVVPKFPVDAVVRTDQKDPADCAQAILDCCS